MTEQEILTSKRPALELRAQTLQSVRSFFLREGFLEVQTPVMTRAPAPEPNIEAIPADERHFLVTSPELYMKRLLAAGYKRIFQITPVFRRGELGRFHHPEFTLLEWYRTGADYTALQEDCRKFLRFVCGDTGRSKPWSYRGHLLDSGAEWQSFTVREAFLRFAGWEPGAHVDQDRFDLDLVQKVEPNLGYPAPCILKDYPAGQAALSRLKPGDPSTAERFELYWAGLELANGFSELTDAAEQRARFEQAMASRLKPYPLPEAFLDSLAFLPPCAGIALGLDRLVLILSGNDHLDCVVAFPPDLA